MKVYITTSDFSKHVLPVFCYLFNKYWDNKQEVVFLGFSKPDFELPDNFSFVSLAPEQRGGVNEWTTYLNNFFSSIQDEHFIFACDDHLVCRDVDLELLEEVKQLCQSDEKVGRFDLSATIQLAKERAGQTSFHSKLLDTSVLKLHQRSAHSFIYKITGQWSVWNREYFLRYCKPHWSPWQWETVGGREAEGDGFEVLGTKDRWCVRKVEGLSGSQFPGILNVMFMHKVDVEEILKNNWCPNHQKKYFRGNYGELNDTIVFGEYDKYEGL